GAQILCRRRGDPVLPDSNVTDVRGALGLAKVRRTGQQGYARVGANIEALEETEAESVVAGQPIHALLREEQQAVELLGRHGGDQAVFPRSHFAFGKMDGHCVSLLLKMIRFRTLKGMKVR